MNKHYLLGINGENFAVDYLKKKGYTILEKRWRYKNLEIDIITQKENNLIIVEVKTRSNEYFGEPYVFVDKKKQKNIIEAANFYIEDKNLDIEVRFDIISLLQRDNKFILNHIENAFIPI